MTETFSRSDMDRAIEAAFRMGFANALAELDGDLHPFGHGRRRRCCTPCSVLANPTAKFLDGRYPWSAPPMNRGPRGRPASSARWLEGGLWPARPRGKSHVNRKTQPTARRRPLSAPPFPSWQRAHLSVQK